MQVIIEKVAWQIDGGINLLLICFKKQEGDKYEGN